MAATPWEARPLRVPRIVAAATHHTDAGWSSGSSLGS
jgi:hypothetical protein